MLPYVMSRYRTARNLCVWHHELGAWWPTPQVTGLGGHHTSSLDVCRAPLDQQPAPALRCPPCPLDTTMRCVADCDVTPPHGLPPPP